MRNSIIFYTFKMRYIIEYKGVFLMVLSQAEMRSRAEIFIEEYKDVSDEHSFAQHFWRDFLHIFGVHWKDVAVFEQAVKKFTGAQGFIDCFWKGKVVIEHKSRGKNLTKAFTQAMGYLDTLSSEEKPRYVIVSDFERIRLIDLFTDKKNEIYLKELTDNLQLFNFIYEKESSKHEVQTELNINASELMGELHDSLKNDGYVGYELELFLIRLLFCVYAEDTGIFKPYQFTDYITNENDLMNVGIKIQLLFRILDQPEEKRQNSLSDELKSFPYVNGKLFETPIVPPSFNKEMYENLKKICNFDWSTISPAIFGSLFQSIMDPELRRELGAHYTSESNILKVVNSLFMNKLWEEFYNAKGKVSKLEALWEKIGKLEFFDPACGCGNFLIVSYKELRLLEYEILSILLDEDKKQVRFDSKSLSKIKLEHFHGIEIEEFPSLIAKLSMWLIEHQMDLKYETLDIHSDNLPLKSPANIVNGNALRMNWKDIVTPTNNLFILGNPPFVGKQEQTNEQKDEMKAIFEGFKNVGKLDYVTAWYKKASEFIEETDIEVSFVSTNSICQGEQVAILWQQLKQRHNIKINFAHQTFKWSNEAKNNAAVYVVIVGFSLKERDEKIIFTYEKPNSQIPTYEIVSAINSYLVEGEDIYLKDLRKPICDVPNMIFGSMPNDGGNLLLTESEKNKLINEEPISKKFIKEFMSAREFLNEGQRYCLWLKNATPSDLEKSPNILNRIKKVKEHRLNSKREATRELANYPTLFAEIRQPESNYVLVPRVSSENREYIPIAFFDSDKIVGDTCLCVPNVNLLEFGILTSKMHMTWMRYVCGRLKGDYRYSASLVYNNFPFPKEIPDDLKNKIINASQKILDVRDKFPNETMAQLYNPELMPPTLRKAHENLDKIVDKAYSSKKFKDDNDRMKILFDLYLEYTSN